MRKENERHTSFHSRCMELLNGYHGIDLFDLDRKELERLLGRDEGKHLDSLLTVQKSNCGVSIFLSL